MHGTTLIDLGGSYGWLETKSVFLIRQVQHFVEGKVDKSL